MSGNPSLLPKKPLDALYEVTSALYAIAELTDPLYASESAAQRFGALALLLAQKLDGIYAPLCEALKEKDAHDGDLST